MLQRPRRNIFAKMRTIKMDLVDGLVRALHGCL
jgi:hypothetical protein